jgi:hypothetical protein
MNIKTIAIATAMTCATAGAVIIPVTPADYNNPKVIELLTPPNIPLVGGFEWENDWCGCYALKEDLQSLIHTDFFQNRPTDTATISWNLPDAYPADNGAPFFRVHAVAVYGNSLAVYEVTGPNKFEGQVTATVEGEIQQIYLYGTVFAPDNGSTLAFLVGALAALLGFQTTKQQTKGTK